MYSLKCAYYKKKFNSVNELLLDVACSGMDPNYMITFNGKSTGEKAADLLEY